jgi:hypothetical protein
MPEPDAPLNVTCATCGREVPIEKTRLFWWHGTYRTCTNSRSCRKAADARYGRTAADVHRERYGEDHP